VSGDGGDGKRREGPPGEPQKGELAGGRQGKRKRAWRAPRVTSGKLFESNSLACGKNSPRFEQCYQNPTSS
jgi:hypothetical protein